MDERWYSGQYGQDRIIDKLCYPKGDETHVGKFLEVGAWDGVDISNSYFLEKVRGWTGLLVEPISSQADSCSHNRWNPVWKGCVFDRDGEVDFFHIKGYSEMLSGVVDGFHPRHIQRINKEISQHQQGVTKLKLASKKINSLMDDFKLVRADYMSLDVQTSELRVLQAYDVKKNPIKVISLDMNGINVEELKVWFATNGYKLHWQSDCSDEYMYINLDIPWSWESDNLISKSKGDSNDICPI